MKGKPHLWPRKGKNEEWKGQAIGLWIRGWSLKAHLVAGVEESESKWWKYLTVTEQHKVKTSKLWFQRKTLASHVKRQRFSLRNFSVSSWVMSYKWRHGDHYYVSLSIWERLYSPNFIYIYIYIKLILYTKNAVVNSMHAVR